MCPYRAGRHRNLFRISVATSKTGGIRGSEFNVWLTLACVRDYIWLRTQGCRFENTKRRHRDLKRRQMAANNYEKGGKKKALKIHRINPVKLLYDTFIYKNKSLNHFIYHFFSEEDTFLSKSGCEKKIFISIWAFQIHVTFDRN